MLLISLLFALMRPSFEIGIGYGLPVGSAESYIQSETHLRLCAVPLRIKNLSFGVIARVCRHYGRKNALYRVDEILGGIMTRYRSGLLHDKLSLEFLLEMGTAKRYLENFAESGALLLLGAGPSFQILKRNPVAISVYTAFTTWPGRATRMSGLETGVQITY